MDYKALIREVPNFPKPGILFYDITTLLKDARAFRHVVVFERFHCESDFVRMEVSGSVADLSVRACLDLDRLSERARQLIDLGDLRLQGQGGVQLAVHRDAITMGERVLIVDDLLATGGTAAATVNLVRQLGGEIMGLVVLVELESLKGRNKLNGCEVHSVITYS